MNRDLSKFEPPKEITCAACGSSNVSGHFDPRKNAWIISCPDCGVSLEMPDNYNASELENEVDILNFYERIRHQVNKSKEEARKG